MKQQNLTHLLDLKAVLVGQPLENARQKNGPESDDQTKGSHLADPSVLPQFPDDNRYDLGTWTVKQEGNRKLSYSDKKDVDPASKQGRKHEREKDLSHRLSPVAATGR